MSIERNVGGYLMLVAERKNPQEIKKLAESCEEKIRDGKMTFNQARECFGLPRVKQKEFDLLWQTKE